MVVYNLHAICISILKNKANTVLIINSNTVLAFSISFKFFQMIRWRNAQVFQTLSIIN